MQILFRTNRNPRTLRFYARWFQEFEPNEATLVRLLGERLFLQKISIPGEPHVAILNEFSGPFKSHDLQELKKGDEGVKYSFIKHVQDEEILNLYKRLPMRTLELGPILCLQRHSIGLEKKFGYVSSYAARLFQFHVCPITYAAVGLQ